MNLRALEAKARSNELEVNDIIAAAATRDANVRFLLQRLQQELGWPHENMIGESHVVPLARWSQVACCFISDGYNGLIEMASVGDRLSLHARYCIAFLSEYRTAESVSALMALLRRVNLHEDRDIAVALASALNQVLSFKGAPPISDDEEDFIRGYLHDFASIASSNAEKATIMCALRAVGNEESLRIIKKMGALPEHWAEVPSLASKKIKQRLRRMV